MNPLHTKRPSERVTRKIGRLCLLALCALGLSLAFAARFVRAQIDDAMLSAGSSMMQLGERMGAQRPRTIAINGAELRLRVSTAKGFTLSQVLDTFETRCRARSGQFHQQIGRRDVKAALSDQQKSLLDGVLRTEREGHGAVACLDVGGRALDAKALTERLQAFAASGDVSKIGGLRFMRAETQADGSVLLVMLWSDGALNLKRMFPSEGDAPGVDFTGIPRPPQSRRLLSAWEQGEAPAMNLYTSGAKDPGEVDHFYRKELARAGFRLLTPSVPKSTRDARGLLFAKDGRTLVLSVSRGSRGQMLVSMLPTDTAGDTKSLRL